MRNIYNEDFFALSDSFQQHQNISNNAIMRDGTRDKIREKRILFGKVLQLEKLIFRMYKIFLKI